MFSFLFAFLLSFTPNPGDSFLTPYSVAFADFTVDAAPATLAPAVTAAIPAPVADPAPAPVAKPEPTPVIPEPAPVAKPEPTSLFANGGVFDPARLANLSKGAGLSADAVVGKVQDFYKDTEHLQAKFRQTVKNKTFGSKSISDGWVFIKKPGKMRWDYYSKKKTKKKKVTKSFISDGNTIWAVFVQDLQYYKKNVKDDLLPVAITFLSGKGDLKKDFNAELDPKAGYGKKGDYIVKLTPKKPSAQYSNLWLVVDSTTFRVKQSIVLNSKGDTNQFAFHEGDTKKKLDDKLFVFNEKAASNKKFRLVNPDKKGK